MKNGLVFRLTPSPCPSTYVPVHLSLSLLHPHPCFAASLLRPTFRRTIREMEKALVREAGEIGRHAMSAGSIPTAACRILLDKTTSRDGMDIFRVISYEKSSFPGIFMLRERLYRQIYAANARENLFRFVKIDWTKTVYIRFML